MAMEAIKGAGMTYQGSVSTAQTKAAAQPKIENAGNEIASKEIAKETMNLSAKEASNDGSSDANNNQAAQQQMDKNKQLRKAVKNGTAHCVYLACNADPAITEPIEALCQLNKVEIAWVRSMQDLGHACGIEVGAAAAAAVD